MGLVNIGFALYNKEKELKGMIALVIGLFFAMLGDILLGKGTMFAVGAGLFALGHVGYYVSYCLLNKKNKLDFIISGAIFIATVLFLTFFPLLSFPDLLMRVVCYVYAAIISLMVGKAISNYINIKNIVNLVLMIGGIMFFISDFMLVLDWFTEIGSWTGRVCMGLYYPAQCVLAFSPCVIILNKYYKK